jgi:2-amino-4-hydroxy-6-hydroxymethyldihydropteridine diphosphokinase
MLGGHGQFMSVYLSLGSNLGNHEENILYAGKILEETGFKIKKTSSLYKTSPWGNTDQPYFLNLVLEGETKLSPQRLLKKIETIEKTLGRKKGEKWGPRKIDIDILFYDNKIIKTSNLKIPHPELHKRNFVLIPLKEIAPNLIHPLLKQSVQQMLKEVDDKGSVVLYNK